MYDDSGQSSRGNLRNFERDSDLSGFENKSAS
jgi:hypothetical protein